MIRKKTVLILGAGASEPYGLLLGSELTDSLCVWAWQAPSENEEVVQLITQCGSSFSELVDFCRAFHRSMMPSVDAFLAHRPNMSGVGKLLIAYLLGKLEVHEDQRWFVQEDHWYRHLWNRMREDCSSAEDILRNEIRIITFNYDRSLEYVLYRAISNTFGVNSEVAHQILGKLWIRHVYGQLAPFHYLGLDGGGRFYTPISNARELGQAANGIHTIPEARQDTDLFKELQDWLYWGERVAFMGFSFDRTNLERLGFPAVIQAKRKRIEDGVQGVVLPAVFACTYGMTSIEAGEAQSRACGPFAWSPINEKNLMFLRSIDFLR